MEIPVISCSFEPLIMYDLGCVTQMINNLDNGVQNSRMHAGQGEAYAGWNPAAPC